MKQHTKPCKECPFRRVSAPGWLGANDPKYFAIASNLDGFMPCHMTAPKEPRPQCAGRATMWANQCKVSRDKSVMKVEPDRVRVFSHIGEFLNHHRIKITPLELMGIQE